MEVVAMLMAHLDGVILSASIATVSALATRYYTIQGCEKDGRTKYNIRTRPRDSTSATKRVGR